SYLPLYRARPNLHANPVRLSRSVEHFFDQVSKSFSPHKSIPFGRTLKATTAHALPERLCQSPNRIDNHLKKGSPLAVLPANIVTAALAKRSPMLGSLQEIVKGRGEGIRIRNRRAALTPAEMSSQNLTPGIRNDRGAAGPCLKCHQ